ncbi:hypothetical protein GCM10014715_23500 [Streptomyces spiralis]|uniref:Uncharacterized protein n=1 Tax=Streptomyces spiralis TaxID=66376 RepID=A0A919DPE1_9ACTN|nr:hypothetical protein GCM10014715_23500 [Streptomyces spiralis]
MVSVFPARAAPVPRSMQQWRPDRLFPPRPLDLPGVGVCAPTQVELTMSVAKQARDGCGMLVRVSGAPNDGWSFATAREPARFGVTAESWTRLRARRVTSCSLPFYSSDARLSQLASQVLHLRKRS